MRKTKAVLDTNILIYGINEDSKYHEDVRRILGDSNFIFYITSKNISEFISVLSKFQRFDVIDLELPTILKKFRVLYPNKKSQKIFLELVDKYLPIGNRVYDMEIVSIMLAHNIQTLFSKNTKDFRDIAEITLIDGTD
jgi:predicted nucleic acid-binding protein